MIDDQVLADISELLFICRREKVFPGPRAEIEAIEARYRDALDERAAAQMEALGWKREGNGWSKAA